MFGGPKFGCRTLILQSDGSYNYCGKHITRGPAACSVRGCAGHCKKGHRVDSNHPVDEAADAAEKLRNSERNGAGSSSRGSAALSSSEKEGLSESDTYERWKAAVGPEYVHRRDYASNRTGAGGGALADAAGVAEMNRLGSTDATVAESRRLAAPAYEYFRVQQRERLDRNRDNLFQLREVELLRLNVHPPPINDTLAISIDAVLRVGGTLSLDGQELTLPPDILMSAVKVRANVALGDTRLQAVESIMGIAGRDYSLYEICRDAFGRHSMSVPELVDVAIDREAIVFVATPNVPGHRAFEDERRFQRIFHRLVSRLHRGFAHVGVGGGGPSIGAAALVFLDMRRLSDIIVRVPDAERDQRIRRSQYAPSARQIATSSSSLFLPRTLHVESIEVIEARIEALADGEEVDPFEGHEYEDDGQPIQQIPSPSSPTLRTPLFGVDQVREVDMDNATLNPMDSLLGVTPTLSTVTSHLPTVDVEVQIHPSPTLLPLNGGFVEEMNTETGDLLGSIIPSTIDSNTRLSTSSSGSIIRGTSLVQPVGPRAYIRATSSSSARVNLPSPRFPRPSSLAELRLDHAQRALSLSLASVGPWLLQSAPRSSLIQASTGSRGRRRPKSKTPWSANEGPSSGQSSGLSSGLSSGYSSSTSVFGASESNIGADDVYDDNDDIIISRGKMLPPPPRSRGGERGRGSSRPLTTGISSTFHFQESTFEVSLDDSTIPQMPERAVPRQPQSSIVASLMSGTAARTPAAQALTVIEPIKDDMTIEPQEIPRPVPVSFVDPRKPTSSFLVKPTPKSTFSSANQKQPVLEKVVKGSRKLEKLNLPPLTSFGFTPPARASHQRPSGEPQTISRITERSTYVEDSKVSLIGYDGRAMLQPSPPVPSNSDVQQGGGPARNPASFESGVAPRTALSSSGQKTKQSESTSSKTGKDISALSFFGSQSADGKVSLLGYEGGRAVHPSPPVLSNSDVAPIVPSTVSKKRQRDDNNVGFELDSEPAQKTLPSQAKDPPSSPTSFQKKDS